ncbi:hypothetical protein [uncultured Litoreibacter sp.]|uniref:hypothetical protein n=1 Tax=uncultured Litoreibacter sp. TaxID=1392394 RepID=UPI00261A3DF0|nr:hypothetical protein [uncultured Litoreibacter sp.]
MKKLLLLSVLGLAACTETRGVHGDWVQGARFAPNDVVEYRARAKRGEPGVFPAPSGYSVYTRQQRIAAGAASADGVIRKGTASSRTGVYSGPGHNARGEPVGHNGQGAQASTTAGNSPHRSNALVAAKSTTTGGQSVNIGNETLKVYHIDVGDTSYAVFRKPSFTGPATIDRAQEGNLQAALPSLTGCSSVAGPFMFGPYGKSNTHMVYALNCG